MADISRLKGILLHPYYAATAANLSGITDETIGVLKEPSGRGRFCLDRSTCGFRHSGFDLNTPGMIDNAPYSALRAPATVSITGAGTTSSGNRYIQMDTKLEMERVDGTKSKARIRYVHLGICDQRYSTGVGGARGLSTPATLIGYDRAKTPAAYFLTWAGPGWKGGVYNYVWSHLIYMCGGAQRSTSYGNVREGDRFDHWFKINTDTPEHFPLPSLTDVTNLGAIQKEGNLFLVIPEGNPIEPDLREVVANVAVEEGLTWATMRILTGAGVKQQALKVGIRGVAGRLVPWLAIAEAMSPASTARWDGMNELFPDYAFMVYGIQVGSFIPRGFLVGFAGNTGTVATRRTGPTAGRHLHLQVYEPKGGEWKLTHPNTFRWRI